MSEKPKQTSKPGLGRGLGRGFEALLPADFDKASLLLANEDRVERLPVTTIAPNPQQPRKHFDETALQELANSIAQYGILQPVVVTPAGNGKYHLIAGERRLRASQLAGLTTIPALVRTSKELEQLELAIVENMQRVDLSPLEQAVSIERWHEQFNVKYDEIGKRLGKGTTTVTNIVRLLNLPPEARDALNEQKITEGHARQILALKADPALQAKLLESIITHGWSVRMAERFVTSIKDGVAEPTKARERVQAETPATRALSQKLGRPVTIHRTAKGGRLQLGFTSDDELETLLTALERLA